MIKNLLIVDDEEINRITLETGLSDIYNTILAKDGNEAIRLLSINNKIDFVLLDLNMPGVDGFDVLKFMTKMGIIHNIPVFVVTATNDNQQIQNAFNYGAVDVVTKPYNIQILKRRIGNTLELFSQRNNLEQLVEEKIYESKQQSNRLVEIMANMVEFRNKESGLHVKRVRGFTKIILEGIISNYSEYKYLTDDDIEDISFAACLHDIGKNSIPDAILTKPGKLTDEEFSVMKTHTIRGYDQLLSMKDIMDPRLYEYSVDIARHHHERYDGKGYPDCIAGDDITIWSQAIGLADVYDALTTVRCYKEAFSHEKAVEMILNGECGLFNPKVIDIFKRSQDEFNSLRQGIEIRKTAI